MDQLYEAMPIPSFSDEEDGRSDGSADDLNVSAHVSCSDSSGASSPSLQSEGEDGAEAGAAPSSSHHRVFSTTSPPEEIYTFLVALLQLAEGLLERLHQAVFREDAQQLPSLPPPRQQQGKMASATTVNGGSRHGASKLRGRLRNEVECVRRAVEGLRAAGCTGTSSTGDVDATNAALSVPPPVLSAAVAFAQCNSLAHFEAIVACLELECDVTGVYVPISGHVGPPQRRTVRTCPTNVESVPGFADAVRIEVDVVSSSEHRWIKVKTATQRSLAMEGAALEMSGSTPFTDMLLALSERAGRACLPHRSVAHVAVVFLYPPPPPLQAFLSKHGMAWTCLPSHQLRSPHCRHVPSRSPWLPHLSAAPRLVCLDTTALVTLCSQSCYAEAMPAAQRLSRLSPYHVLQEQQRKELVECAAVAAVMEPALRRNTRWGTLGELNSEMRSGMLREDGMPREAAEGPFAARASIVPGSLLHTMNMSWLAHLQQTTQAHSGDLAVGHGHASMEESPLLRECSAQLAQDAAKRPNWIIADITYDEFRWILETIAGPEEVARAARLLSLVTVVRTDFLRERMRGVRDGTTTDAETVTTSATGEALLSPLLTSVEYLRVSGKVSLRNKVVFGLADAVGAVIVTSNEQFCHAAREQGVVLAASFHPSRSLTEQKMYALRRQPGPGKPPAV